MYDEFFKKFPEDKLNLFFETNMDKLIEAKFVNE